MLIRIYLLSLMLLSC